MELSIMPQWIVIWMTIWVSQFLTFVNNTEWCPHRVEHLRLIHHLPRLKCPVACCGDLSNLYCCDDATKQIPQHSTVMEAVILSVILACFLFMISITLMVCCSRLRRKEKQTPQSECPSLATVTSQMEATETQESSPQTHLQVPTPNVFILSDGIYHPPAYSHSPPPIYRRKYVASPPPAYNVNRSPVPLRRGSWSVGNTVEDGYRKFHKERRLSLE